MENFLDNLSKSCWETCCARYNASRRLKIREVFSTVSIALIGVSGIALNLIQFQLNSEEQKNLNNIITIGSIVMSITLIVISLIEWGYGASAKSEVLFRNAELLNRHERKIKFFKNKKPLNDQADVEKEIDALREEYEQIKLSCVFNHSPIDYEYHKVNRKRFYICNSTEHFNLTRILSAKIQYYFISIWGYLILWGAALSFFIFIAKHN